MPHRAAMAAPYVTPTASSYLPGLSATRRPHNLVRHIWSAEAQLSLWSRKLASGQLRSSGSRRPARRSRVAGAEPKGPPPAVNLRINLCAWLGLQAAIPAPWA